ncbi:MAG TPA: hypothetical protein V6C89_18100 [Drouetiella sp.]|jgi:hypothetical protein
MSTQICRECNLSCARVKRSLAIFIVLVFTAWSPSIPCSYAASKNVDTLAREIFFDELEMQKINSHLHLEAATPSFKRSRRTWLWDISNGVTTESGLVSAAAIFWDHSEDKTTYQLQRKVENGLFINQIKSVRKHNRVSGSTVAGTLYPQIVGQAIGGSGAAFELGCDLSRSARIRANNLDEASVFEKMLVLNKHSDALLNELQRTESSSKEELKLLLDMKMEILQEFIRLEGQSGDLLAGQYIEDSVSLIRNTVGLVGNSINAKAVISDQKKLNGVGNILNCIAASMITMRPVITNVGASIVKRRNKRRARRYFPELDKWGGDDLNSDLMQLSNTEHKDESFNKRLLLYNEQLEQFAEYQALAKTEQASSKLIALRMYRESIYGPAKVSQSIMGMIVGFQNGDNATRDNRLAAAGNTTYMTGQAFNIIELTRERIVDERDHADLVRAQMLPADRIRRHLKNIEHLKSEVALNR